MSEFVHQIPNDDPDCVELATELRAIWRQIERHPANELRVAIFYEHMEIYLKQFACNTGEGEQWDRRR